MWNLIRVLEATPKGPWRGSQRPMSYGLTVTKQERRQRATTTIFSPDGPTRREDQGLPCNSVAHSGAPFAARGR
jgi:hypothetical protein